MHNFLQTLVSGVEAGSIYAFLALAIVLVYQSTGMINFAQGEMGMFATFISWTFVEKGMPPILAIIAAMVLSFVFAAALEFFIVRRVVDRTGLDSPTALSSGMLLLINNLAGALWLYDPKVFHILPLGVISLGRVRMSYQTASVIGVLGLAVILLFLLFRYTNLGLALRAVVSNRESASLCGARPGRMLMFGWGLAAALGALAGALIAPTLFLSPMMMLTVLTYAMAGAALGGFDSLTGAVIGAMIIGVSENMAAAYIGIIGSDLKVIVPVVILLIVLLFRPWGLMGRRPVTRV
ncbi:MAG: branched-chain amino acid ABC transporter permease [Thermovirgaceae bacterium]|nr:branched-chain amino acid ABC transporter permease [Thermovirga sp.]